MLRKIEIILAMHNCVTDDQNNNNTKEWRKP